MKFNSRFSPGKKVSGTQLIAELICEKKAVIEGIELPDKFWTLNKWLNHFKYQTKPASELVKEFGVPPILKALRDKRTDRIYSLKHPIVRKLCAEYKSEVTLTEDEVVTEANLTRKSIGLFVRKQTNLDLLD